MNAPTQLTLEGVPLPKTTILVGDALAVLRTLPSESVHCAITSPPYWNLRDYGVAGQLGLEGSLPSYIAALVEVFEEVKRVLRRDGTLWLNIGDKHLGGRSGGIGASALTSGRNHVAAREAWLAAADQRTHLTVPGLKPKDLVGVPWRVAFALQDAGWWLRSDIVWSKRNCMPESVRDRPTRAHEYVFLFAKSRRYYYDARAVAEPIAYPDAATAYHASRAFSRKRATAVARSQGAVTLEGETPTHRNKRSVWSIPTQPYKGKHRATFPPGLARPCVLAGCPRGGVVLDPFGGAGTTALVASEEARDALLIEINEDTAIEAQERLVARGFDVTRRAA